MGQREEVAGEEASGTARRLRGIGTARVVTIVVVVLLVGGGLRVANHSQFFLRSHPANIGALVAAVLLGVGLVGIATRELFVRAGLTWVGFGVLGAWLGSALGAGIDAWMARILHEPFAAGAAAPTGVLVRSMALGIGSGVASTFAAALVFRLLDEAGALLREPWVSRVGLAVGVGFGVAAVVITWEQQTVRRVVLSPGLPGYVWSGAWVIGLQGFSGLALARGFHRRTVGPLLVVLVIQVLAATAARWGAAPSWQPLGVPADVAGTFLALAVFAYTGGAAERSSSPPAPT